MKKQAFSYIRMSTKEQLSGDSLRRQIERSRQYSDKMGYSFINSLQDIGISAYRGRNHQEGELADFISSIKSGKIDPQNTVLLIESFDRFSRQNPFIAFQKLSEFINLGLEIVTIIDEQHYSLKSIQNNIGLLYTAVGVLSRAHEESRIKGERLSSVWANKRANMLTTPQKSMLPGWLSFKNKQFVVDDHAKKCIQQIFLMSRDGKGCTATARWLNLNQQEYYLFTTSKRGWHESYIKKILNHRALLGEFQPHKMIEGKRVATGDPILNYFPQIITSQEFDLVQAKIQQRRIAGSGRKGKSFSNIFTRLVTCAHCRGNMKYLNKGSGAKGGIYLQCANSHTKNGCTAPLWRYADFEESFFTSVSEIVLNDVDDSHLLNHLERIEHELTDQKIEYKNIISHLTEYKNSPNDRRIAALNDELLNKEKVLDDLQHKIKTLKGEIALLPTKNANQQLSELWQRLKDNRNDVELRTKIHSTIQQCCDSIVIENDFSSIFDWEIIDSLPSWIKVYDGLENELIRNRRRFNEMMRNITITFRGLSGKRIIYPYINRTVKPLTRNK